MSFEIEKATLGDFLTFKNGRKSPERSENANFPVFGSNGLIGRSESVNCPENTIIIGRVGSYCGSVHFSKEECWVSDNAISCSLKNAEEEHFWFYFLTKLNLNQFSSGSGQPLLNQATLNAVECEVPHNASTRVLIGNVLHDYDKKIKLNSKTNQTLEEMAQAIFKSWFVDFDPVKAKMLGEQPEGMDAATAALFPDKLVESELGLIPEGWEIKTIKSLSEKISKGTTPSKKDLSAATDAPSIRFLKVRDINNEGEVNRDNLELIPNYIHTTKLKRSMLEKQDILFSIAGTIGRVAIVDQDLNNINTNQAVSFIRLTNKALHLPLVYMTLRDSRTQQKAVASIVQGVQANLSLTNIGDMEVIVPSDDVLSLWNKQYSSILKMIKTNFAQSRELSNLRDTLLPKLLSGEIELSE